MTKFPIKCPRCQQGRDLHAVRVKGIDETIFVCHECDATWTSVEAIGTLPVVDFETYLRKKNIDPIFSQIKVIDDLFDTSC